MTLRVAGASERGPAHEKSGRPNQDAWYARVTKSGALAVVADGLGSRVAAREGACAAVAACRAAWRHWVASPSSSGEDLVRLIEVLWRMKLGRTPPGDASTTCLVCALRTDSSGVALQLGDGLVGVGDMSGGFRAITPEKTAFGTATLALGTPHGLRDWVIAPMSPFEPGTALLLASDGVADDLLPEKREPFLRWIIRSAESSCSPRGKISRALRSWPVPGHSDDKTIVAVWETAS